MYNDAVCVCTVLFSFFLTEYNCQLLSIPKDQTQMATEEASCSAVSDSL